MVDELLIGLCKLLLPGVQKAKNHTIFDAAAQMVLRTIGGEDMIRRDR